jgi:hypothetical protein
MADYKDQWGRSQKRPLDIVIGWLKGFAKDWKSEDQSALEMAKIVRKCYFYNLKLLLKTFTKVSAPASKQPCFASGT